jgi:hypothetical protein
VLPAANGGKEPQTNHPYEHGILRLQHVDEIADGPELPLRDDRSLLCYLQFADVLSTRSTSKAEGSTTDVG